MDKQIHIIAGRAPYLNVDFHSNVLVFFGSGYLGLCFFFALLFTCYMYDSLIGFGLLNDMICNGSDIKWHL